MVSETDEPHRQWVSGSQVVLEAVALPQSLTGEELSSALALHLEEASPFPPEQLFWGYLRGREERVWLILVPRHHLNGEIDPAASEIPVWHQVTPALALFEALSPDSLIRVEIGQTILVVVPAREPEGEPAAYCVPTSTEEALWKRLGQNPAVAAHYTLHDSATPSSTSKETLTFQSEGPETASPSISLSAADQWSADLRPLPLKQRHRKRLVWQKQLTRAFIAGCLLLGVSLAAMLLVGAIDRFQLHRPGDLTRLQSESSRLEDSQELVLSLRQIGDQGLRPLHLLSEVNQRRPDSIYFSRTDIRSPRSLHIRGVAPDIAQLNTFVAALRDLPTTESVSLADQRRQADQVSFILDVVFGENNETAPDPAP